MNFPVSEVVLVTITLDNRKSAVVIIFLFMKDRKVDIKNILSFIEILAEYPISKKNLYSLYLKDEHLQRQRNKYLLKICFMKVQLNSISVIGRLLAY